MKKGICYIVGAGEVGRLSITRAPGDYLVAADGGLEKLRPRIGARPGAGGF